MEEPGLSAGVVCRTSTYLQQQIRPLPLHSADAERQESKTLHPRAVAPIL